MLGIPEVSSFFTALINSWSANASLTPSTTLQYLVATLISPLRTARVSRRLSFLNLSLDPVRDLYDAVSAAATDCRRTRLRAFQTSLPAFFVEDRNSMAHWELVSFSELPSCWVCISLPVDRRFTMVGVNTRFELAEYSLMQLLGVVPSSVLTRSVPGSARTLARCWSKLWILP